MALHSNIAEFFNTRFELRRNMEKARLSKEFIEGFCEILSDRGLIE